MKLEMGGCSGTSTPPGVKTNTSWRAFALVSDHRPSV